MIVEVFIKAIATFVGVSGDFMYFEEIDGVLYRQVSRDVSFSMEDCSYEKYICIRDETGFELAFPSSMLEGVESIFDRSWETGRHGYSINSTYTSRESGDNYILYQITRTNGDGDSASIHVRSDCGVTYFEAFAEERPNFFNLSIGAKQGFYSVGCVTFR